MSLRRTRPPLLSPGNAVRAAALVLPGLIVPAGLADAAESAALQPGVAAYTEAAAAQIDAARDGARRLQTFVAAGDVAGAQRAWLESHAAWERSETFTASLYPDLDDAIDAWPDAKAGYHSIEPKLFAGELADIKPGVAALVQQLETFSAQIRVKGLTAQGLLDGTTSLAFETGEHKAAGGESVASGTSYDDMKNNVQGINAVFATVIGPALKSADPALFRKAEAQLGEMQTLLRAPDLRALDQTRYAKAAEQFAGTLRSTAPLLGLKAPALGD